MENDIKYIQNTLWAMYKEFLTSYNVRRYTQQAVELRKKYDDNSFLSCFCQNMIISWTPVINRMAEEHRSEVA